MNKIKLLFYKNINKINFIFALVFLPLISFSQSGERTIFNFFLDGAGAITGWSFSLAVIIILAYFMVGVFKYVQSAGDAQKKSEGSAAIIHGLIGLFILVSVWGIISLLTKTFFNDRFINPTL